MLRRESRPGLVRYGSPAGDRSDGSRSESGAFRFLWIDQVRLLAGNVIYSVDPRKQFLGTTASFVRLAFCKAVQYTPVQTFSRGPRRRAHAPANSLAGPRCTGRLGDLGAAARTELSTGRSPERSTGCPQISSHRRDASAASRSTEAIADARPCERASRSLGPEISPPFPKRPRASRLETRAGAQPGPSATVGSAASERLAIGS